MKIRRNVLLLACGFAIHFASPQSSAQTTTKPAGLDSLSDDRLMSDLANRGQSALLEHATEVNHVAPAQHDALRSMPALHQLNDPKAHLTASQRQAVARQSVAGIEASLATIHDPQTLLDQANALLMAGVVRD